MDSRWDGCTIQTCNVTVENAPVLIGIAQEYLREDRRVIFHVGDGADFMEKFNSQEEQLDLIFADTWAGKYTHLNQAIQVLKPGGLYVIDDM
ncbi:MAG: hypothetical protein HRU34_18040 [Richelia sp.]|nr:hypothetical protein [Richelia sp.]